MVPLVILLTVFVCFTEGKATTKQLLAAYGLPCETHDVVTKDGYILTVFRVPNTGSIPVLVMPGFLSSSNTWVVAPRNESIILSLAQNGYDVWLLNYRGGYYGKKHTQLDIKEDAAKFWDFTFHEIGTIDLPTMIDYIQKVTGKEQMLYIGHSMGGLSFYVMCSEKPEYCNKIRAAGLLAPVIYPPDKVDRYVISAGIGLVKRYAAAARKMGVHELFGNEKERSKQVKQMCSIPIIGQSLCKLGLVIPFSRSAEKIDEKSLPNYVVNTLSGTSVKLAEHMTQLMTSKGRIPKFDYGYEENLRKYKNQFKIYNGTISAPVIVFHSTSDPFTDQKAINRLKKVAPVVYDKLIRDPTFNHINFVFSKDLHKYIIDDLLTLFNRVKNV